MGRKEPNRKQGEEPKQSRWGFRGMTVRDWMDLLIVPLVLVVIGLVFTMLQDARQQDLENQRARQAQKIENQRAEAERELAVRRAQDEALQAYLSQIGSLLLEKDLRGSDKGSEVRTLARARTLTVLGRLDPSRKTAVMQFLVEADLVQSVEGREPIITLSGANLFGANLFGASLGPVDLSKANLSGANLRGAYKEVNFQGTKRQLITNEELEQQVRSLEGATMPNGQKYEDWLKDKGNQQDE